MEYEESFYIFCINYYYGGCGNVDDKSETNTMISTSENPAFEVMDKATEFRDEVKVGYENVEENNIDGISHSNRNNGGWVTEQGDWNYYIVDANGKYYYILKENIITGEKYQLMTYDDPIVNISVMGDWIYFSTSFDNSSIARIKTDGQNYSELVLNTQEQIKDWFTYNGDLYAIVPEHMSASRVEDYIVKVNWESETYEKVYNCGNEGFGSFLGTRAGYVFFVKETRIQESSSKVHYEYEFKRVSLDAPDEDVSSVNYTRLQEEQAPDMWRINNDGLILGFKTDNWWVLGGNQPDYFIWAIDFGFKETIVRKIPELNDLRNDTLWNLNCYGDVSYMAIAGSIIAIYEVEEMVDVEIVSEDSTSGILGANDRIYYRSRYDGHNMYCYYDEMGWNELKVEDFTTIN